MWERGRAQGAQGRNGPNDECTCELIKKEKKGEGNCIVCKKVDGSGDHNVKKNKLD
jgi:hypothetical protein